MKIAFLGTPDFAIPSLELLISRGNELRVFTQPDRPVGRGGRVAPPPVKAFALERGIPVSQFERIKSPEGVAALREFAPKLMVTAAFGQLLSRENLDIPKYGCINVHASLLPKYRGAAPIQWAIINGESETGVTTMQTELGLDSGDILLQKRLSIDPDETAGELFERLASLGAEVLGDTLALLELGELKPKKQDELLATKCSMIKKEQGKIDFSLGMKRVHDLVRGADPWPGAYASLEGETVKIWKTRITDEPGVGRPGLCVKADPKRGLFADAGDGLIELTEIQFPGSRRMQAREALRSRQMDGKAFI